MKEDVLEQVVEDYLHSRGYFTRHNLKFRPAATRLGYSSREHSVHSDIDVIGVNPRKRGVARVWVVSCKSWQSGFDAERKLKELHDEVKNPVRPFWKQVRELWVPIWSDAFREAVTEASGQSNFKYSIAVSKLSGGLSGEQAGQLWASDPQIATNLAGCRFSFLTMAEMWHELQEELTTTPANSEIGRLAQMLRAAGV